MSLYLLTYVKGSIVGSSSNIHPQVSTESFIWAYSKRTGGSIPSFSETKGERDRRGSFNGRSCSYDDIIPPKYAVSKVVGFIKGKSAIHIARTYSGRQKNYVGQHFWARGYFVSTIGRNEQVIREYIRHPENEDRRVDQLKLI